MLILVLGNTSTGKTYFITKYRGELPEYDTSRKIKVYSHSGKALRDPEILKLVLIHRHLSAAGEIDFDDMFVEANSDLSIPPNIRANADFIVFTSSCAFEQYFCRASNGTNEVDVGAVIRAYAHILSPGGVVIWNANTRKFKCIHSDFVRQSIDVDNDNPFDLTLSK